MARKGNRCDIRIRNNNCAKMSTNKNSVQAESPECIKTLLDSVVFEHAECGTQYRIRVSEFSSSQQLRISIGRFWWEPVQKKWVPTPNAQCDFPSEAWKGFLGSIWSVSSCIDKCALGATGVAVCENESFRHINLCYEDHDGQPSGPCTDGGRNVGGQFSKLQPRGSGGASKRQSVTGNAACCRKRGRPAGCSKGKTEQAAKEGSKKKSGATGAGMWRNSSASNSTATNVSNDTMGGSRSSAARDGGSPDIGHGDIDSTTTAQHTNEFADDTTANTTVVNASRNDRESVPAM